METTTNNNPYELGQNSTAQNVIMENLYVGGLPIIKNYYPGILTTGQPYNFMGSVMLDDEDVQAEKLNYEQNKSKYIKGYLGKYIALMNGSVLDSDVEFSSLATRLYEQMGYQSFFITFVTDKQKNFRRMPSL